MSRDSRDQYHYSSFGLIPRDWIQTPELRPEAQRLSESGPPSRVSSMRKSCSECAVVSVQHQVNNSAYFPVYVCRCSAELWPVADPWERVGCVFLLSFAPVDSLPGINPLAPAAFAAPRRLELARIHNYSELIP